MPKFKATPINNKSYTTYSKIYWEPTPVWNEMLDGLKQFMQEHGHIKVPASMYNLNRWLCAQRRCRASLTPAQIQALDDIGIDWETIEDAHERIWKGMYLHLKTFQQTHGHCNIPSYAQNFPEDPELATWVASQRSAYRMKARRLTPTQRQLLEELGFSWKAPKLVATDDSVINASSQSLASMSHALTGSATDQSESVAAPGGSNTPSWNEMMVSLTTIKQEHGHTRVPWTFPTLSKWVSKQRTCRDLLTPAQIKALNDVGFDWETLDEKHEKAWNSTFLRLKDFQKEHGHCNVPCNYKDMSLWRWTGQQRHKYRSKKLSHHRQQRLNELGFSWSAPTAVAVAAARKGAIVANVSPSPVSATCTMADMSAASESEPPASESAAVPPAAPNNGCIIS